MIFPYFNYQNKILTPFHLMKLIRDLTRPDILFQLFENTLLS